MILHNPQIFQPIGIGKEHNKLSKCLIYHDKRNIKGAYENKRRETFIYKYDKLIFSGLFTKNKIFKKKKIYKLQKEGGYKIRQFRCLFFRVHPDITVLKMFRL